jgi:hypothetical protein
MIVSLIYLESKDLMSTPWSSAMSDGKRSKDSPNGSAVGGDDREHRSADERRAAGKALRNAVPRSKHGGWTAPKNRRDPLDVLDESNKGRLAQLIPIRFGRMAKSPFNFFRGSAAIMAADLASTPQSGLRVQACGDAHLLNFGCFATPERKIIFDINDFDETLPAPWEWDVKRLVASIVIAARHLGLDDSEAARMATDTACSNPSGGRLIHRAARKAVSLSRPFRLMTSGGRSGPAFPSSALQAGRYPGTRFGRRSCVQGRSMRGFVARECEGEGRNYDDPGAGH